MTMKATLALLGQREPKALKNKGGRPSKTNKGWPRHEIDAILNLYQLHDSMIHRIANQLKRLARHGVRTGLAQMPHCIREARV